MDRILMRHDDVNTFGVVLYAAADPEQSNITVLYKDEECTKLVGYEEALTLMPKVNVIKLVEFSDDYNSVFSKIVAYNIARKGAHHKVYIKAPEMQSGEVVGFTDKTVYIKP